MKLVVVGLTSIFLVSVSAQASAACGSERSAVMSAFSEYKSDKSGKNRRAVRRASRKHARCLAKASKK